MTTLMIDFGAGPTVAVRGVDLPAVAEDAHKSWWEREYLWKAQDGLWSISAMQTSHLRNALAYMRRNAVDINVTIEIGWLNFEDAMGLERPDDVGYGGATDLWHVRHYPIYRAMLAELWKRRRKARGLS